MSLYTKLVHFVLLTTKKYGIDESHGLSHSLNVLHFSNKIYENELDNYPIIKNQERIIYTSAILHDMCDKKYMDEQAGLKDIDYFLHKETYLTQEEINISKKIMSTMSYSKVKKVGFPDMGYYQPAYHIVREADLLSAYDFDRCMIYQINKNGGDIIDAYYNACELFEKRVLKHNDDDLFLFDYSKKKSLILHNLAIQRISSWKNIITNPINKMRK
jgi:hypothetical protein